MLLDLFGGREDDERRKRIETGYIVLSVAIYTAIYLFGR